MTQLSVANYPVDTPAYGVGLNAGGSVCTFLLYAVADAINLQTGTTYTLQASDLGKIVELSNASAITLTVPNSLSVGFNCVIRQVGAGQVTVTAGSGATVRNRSSHGKLAGQWAEGSLSCRANSGGSAAEVVFSGDTSA